jgi:hypothetical protein
VATQVDQGVPTDEKAPCPSGPISPQQVLQSADKISAAVDRVEKSVARIDYEQLGRQVAANVDFKSEISIAIGKKQQILDLVLASIALMVSLGVLVMLIKM